LIGGLALVALTGNSSVASAHRLDAQVTVTPARRVTIESWFSSGDVPSGANVQVYDAAGRPMQEGTLDSRGTFEFVADAIQGMRVVVNAGAGHRKEVTITDADVATGAQAAPLRVSTRETGAPWRDVFSGVALLLAVAAFAISVRNARKLQRLSQPAQARDASKKA
jgi:hypothetical protein